MLYRKLKHGYEFRKIKLTKGQFAIVDADDYEKLRHYCWYAKGNGYTFYAARKEKIAGRKKTVSMHRQIMRAEPDKVVDHINGNGLDNRKANLRVVSQEENNWNSARGMGQGKSKYKGVRYSSSKGIWRAALCSKGKQIHLGYFKDEAEAAKAYDNAAKLYRGEFARVNFE